MIRYVNISFCWVTLLLLYNTAAVAQHYKRIPTNRNQSGYIDFDSSGLLNYVNSPYRWTSYYAKSNGEPWFYFNGNTKEIRYSTNEISIKNGSVIGGSNVPIFQLTDSTYLISSFKGVSYIVKSRKELEVIDNSLTFQIKGDNIACVGRISEYKYLLVTKYEKNFGEVFKFYLHVLDKDGISLTDSMSFDTTLFKQPIQWNIPGLRKYNYGGGALLNNNSSKMYLSMGGRGRYTEFPVFTDFLVATSLLEVEITEDGKINGGLRQLFYKEYYDFSLDMDVFQRTLLGVNPHYSSG